VDMLGSGGIPLQLLAVLTHVVRFSEEPVAVGDQWDCQDQYEVPGIGTVPINTRWKLKEVTENVASLVSTAAAALPTFKTPNPMVPGADMDVKDGKVLVTELKQQYDMGKSRVTSSQGTLKLQASVDMQGMAMAVTATVTFSAEMAEEQPEKAEKGDKAG